MKYIFVHLFMDSPDPVQPGLAVVVVVVPLLGDHVPRTAVDDVRPPGPVKAQYSSQVSQ